MARAALTGDESWVSAERSEALTADLVGRLSELDTRTCEEALEIYGEISAALATALDGSERSIEPETGTASPPAPPTGVPAGGR